MSRSATWDCKLLPGRLLFVVEAFNGERLAGLNATV